jgi:hypothetical protein
MSFMIIRLLQAFSSFTLDEEAFAPEGRPPREWANTAGRKSIERFRPKLHLTMSTAVSTAPLFSYLQRGY